MSRRYPQYKSLLGRLTVALLAFAGTLIFAKPAFADFWISQVLRESRRDIWYTSTPVYLVITIIIIETIIIHLMCKASWKDSIVLSIVMNIVSSLIGWIAVITFSMEFAPLVAACQLWVMAVVAMALTWTIWSWMLNGITRLVPKYFKITAILTGVLGAYGWWFRLRMGSDISTGDAWMYLFLPVLSGFGTSLVIEGYCARRYKFPRDLWRGIFVANIASYIFLAMVVLFFGNTVYENRPGWYGSYVKYRLLADSEENSNEMIEFLHNHRLTNFQLLGFVERNMPPENYKARFELAVLEGTLLSRSPLDYNVERGIDIADDVLALPSLDKNAKDKMLRIRGWFSSWRDFRDAVELDDQELALAVYAEWEAKLEKDPPPFEMEYSHYQLWHLAYIIIEEAESEIEMPPLKEDAE